MGKIETMKEQVDNVSKEKEMLRNNLKENYRNHKHYRNEKLPLVHQLDPAEERINEI